MEFFYLKFRFKLVNYSNYDKNSPNYPAPSVPN